MRRFLSSLSLGAVLAFSAGAFSPVAHAQTAQVQTIDNAKTLSYQGYITAANGQAVKDGDYPVTVSLYSDKDGQNSVWTGTYMTHVVGGVFNLALGSGVTPLPSSAVLDGALFAGVTFNGGDEMRPLTPLSASPYALNVADGAVTAKKMGTDYVGNVTLNGQAVTGRGTNLNIVTDGIDATVDPATNTMVLRNLQSSAVVTTKGSDAQSNTTISGTLTVTGATYLNSAEYLGSSGHSANLFLYGGSGSNTADVHGNNAGYTSNRVYNVPDIGVDANFLFDNGTQSIGGTLTVSNPMNTHGIVNTGTISSTGNIQTTTGALITGDATHAGSVVIYDGAGNKVTASSAVQGADRAATIPAMGADGSFVMTHAAATQTISTPVDASTGTGDVTVRDVPTNLHTAINTTYLNVRLASGAFVPWDYNAIVGAHTLPAPAISPDAAHDDYNAINLQKNWSNIDQDYSGNAVDGDMFHFTTINLGVGSTGTANFNSSGAVEGYQSSGPHTVTVFTTAPHNFRIGETVVVAGATPSGFNGTFTVASITAPNQFTYFDDATGLGTSSTSGTATVSTESTTAKWDAQGVLWTLGTNVDHISNYTLNNDLGITANGTGNIVIYGDHSNLLVNNSLVLGNGLQDATNYNVAYPSDLRGRLYFNDASNTFATSPASSNTVLVQAPISASAGRSQTLLNTNGNISVGGIDNGVHAGSILYWNTGGVVNPSGALSILDAAENAGQNTTTIQTTSANGFYQGEQVTISGVGDRAIADASENGIQTTTTIVTSTPHDLATNDQVTISGVNANYNGVYTITVVNPTTFTYTNNLPPASDDAGAGGQSEAFGWNGTFSIASIVNTTTFTYSNVTPQASDDMGAGGTSSGLGNDFSTSNGGGGGRYVENTHFTVTSGGNLSTDGNISTTGTGTITSAGLLTGSNGLTVSAGAVELDGITSDANPTQMLTFDGSNDVRYTTMSGTAKEGITYSSGAYRLGSASTSANPFLSNRDINLDTHTLTFTGNGGANTMATLNGTANTIDLEGTTISVNNTTNGTTNVGTAAGATTHVGNSTGATTISGSTVDIEDVLNHVWINHNASVGATNIGDGSGAGAITIGSAGASGGGNVTINTANGNSIGIGNTAASTATVNLGASTGTVALKVATTGGLVQSASSSGNLSNGDLSGDVTTSGTLGTSINTSPGNNHIVSAINSGTGVINVANGGTGDATLTLNAVLYGNSTSGVLNTGASSAVGQFLQTTSSGGAPTWKTILAIANGGTNASTALGAFNNLSPLTTQGDVLYFDGTNNARLAAGTTGMTLHTNGGSSNPTWAKVNLASTSEVTGTLPVGNGGTGDVNPTSGSLLVGAGSSAMSVLSAGTNGTVLTSNGSTPSYNFLTTNSSLTGDGTDASFGLNLAHTNVWTAAQTFDGSINIGDATHQGIVQLYDNTGRYVTVETATLSNSTATVTVPAANNGGNFILSQVGADGVADVQTISRLQLQHPLGIASGGTGTGSNSAVDGAAVFIQNPGTPSYTFTSTGGTDANFLVTAVSGGVHTPAWVAMTGDASITNAGVISVSHATNSTNATNATNSTNAANLSGTNLTGDVHNTSDATTVVGLQGRTLSSSAPTNGQVLTWVTGNSDWEPAASSVSSMTFANITAGTNVGNNTDHNAMVVGSTDASHYATLDYSGFGTIHASSAATLNNTAGAGNSAVTAINAGSGTINNANLNVGTGANQLVAFTAADKYPAVDGSLITNISGANVSGTVANATNAGSATNATNAANLSGTNLTGDVHNSSDATTVVGLQGRTLASTAPTNGQVLTWVTGNSDWEPQSSSVSSLGFDNITSSVSSNTGHTMTVGNGSTLAATGTGIIHATTSAALDNTAGAGNSAVSAINAGSGTINNANLNVGTGANQLVAFTAADKYPAVDGSLITNINPAAISPGTITGATITNSSIGSSSPSTGAFTTMTATHLATTGSSNNFAGTAAVTNTSGGPVLTMTKVIANTSVTASSVIIVTAERDGTSAAGVSYLVNLTNGGRVAGTSFSVDIKRQLNANIGQNEGCTINYIIIN